MSDMLKIDAARLDFVPLRDTAHIGPYHDIRRIELFERYEPQLRYHPGLIDDEDRPGRLGHVLLLDGHVVGTLRVDLIDHARAGFRLVAIRGAFKNLGLGGWMLQRSEAIVAAYGRTSIVVNAAIPAARFYLRHGYAEGDWPDVRTIDPSMQVRLGKRLEVSSTNAVARSLNVDHASSATPSSVDGSPARFGR